MPRIARRLIVEEEKQVHKVWRSHDREWNIERNEEKEKYLEFMVKLLPKQENKLNAYGVMSSHSHEVYDIRSQQTFSELMRNHHSRYGMYYNRLHNRRGKVAYDRPRTSLIENDDYSMRAIFYIHANPVRAGVVKDAKDYRWSTHRLYAYGKKDFVSEHIEFPGWYMELGGNWDERRRQYRQLFDRYLKEMGLLKQIAMSEIFYGSAIWVARRKKELKKKHGVKRTNGP